MLFGGKKTRADTGQGGSRGVTASQELNDDLKTVTESLYKQNLELSVKNKTLSLLRALYQISLRSLKTTELGEKIIKTVRETLEFESAGIVLFDSEKQQFKPLKCDETERQREFRAEHRIAELPEMSVTECPFLADIVKSKSPMLTKGLFFVAKNSTGGAEMLDGSHVKETVGYPLAIEGRVIGVLLIGLNRDYGEMNSYEKESIASIVDVTAVALDKSRLYEELEDTNSKLSAANVRLKELDATKSEFISLATHQIRSPLTAIKGYSSLILDGDYGKISPQLRDVVQIIFDSCENLVVIVNEFLDISRIEQGRMKYDVSTFDLKVLVEETIQELLPNVEQAGLGLEFHHKKGQNYAIDADKNKVRQVVSNLIDNSIKYTPEGTITVGIENKDGKVRLMVADTGVGIDPHEKEKLFAKFIRAKDANRVNVTGTGLGLFIAREMIEAQGGRIWVESAGAGKGSTFYVEMAASDKKPE